MKRALLVGALAVLAECSQKPLWPTRAPEAKQYTRTPVNVQSAAPGVRGGEPQQLVPGKDVPREWWTLFKSPALDETVRRALDGSPTLARAGAKLKQ